MQNDQQENHLMLNVIMGSPITQSVPVFILCGRCHWCPTYLDTNRILQEYKVDDDNNKICPRCDTIDSLSSLPILSNESFTFDYSIKRGIVLQFKKRDQLYRFGYLVKQVLLCVADCSRTISSKHLGRIRRNIPVSSSHQLSKLD